MWIYREDQEPPLWFKFFGGLLGAAVCLGQGLIVAGAVGLALYHDASRWDWLWYVVGFVWSAPIALVKGLSDPEDKWAWCGILISEIAYVVACISPTVIPLLLLRLSIKVAV